MSVKTGDEFGAGTDANVFLEMFGEKGESGRLPLESAEKRGNKFERDQTDTFRLEASDIGRLKRIRIGHDGSGPGSPWYLQEVRIAVPTRGENYMFRARRWLADDKGGREVELQPAELREGVNENGTSYTSNIGAGSLTRLQLLNDHVE